MTDEYKAVLKQIISNKLSETINDIDIEMSIEEVEQYVLNYCMISSVPYALRFVMANMVVDLLNYQYYKKTKSDTPSGSGDTGVVGIGNISNIKIGDTEVKLGSWNIADNRTMALKSHTPNLDVVLFNYNEQLNRFRRIF